MDIFKTLKTIQLASSEVPFLFRESKEIMTAESTNEPELQKP